MRHGTESTTTLFSTALKPAYAGRGLEMLGRQPLLMNTHGQSGMSVVNPLWLAVWSKLGNTYGNSQRQVSLFVVHHSPVCS